MTTATDKLNLLIQHYSRVSRFPKKEKYKNIFTIGAPMRWILADIEEQYLSIYKRSIEDKILDIDISSCFPTICKFLFLEENPKFIEDIIKQPTKLEKNIFIANTLKETPYLKILNMISKMVITGFIFDRQDSEDVSLLEFEKDGCLIFCNNISYYKSIENNILDSPFLEFIELSEFKFRFTEFDYYLRCNNTSWFWSDNDKLRLKGMYKHVPPVVEKFYNDIFSGIDIDIDKFINTYKISTLKFIRDNNLQSILKDYYFCGDDNRVLNTNGRFEKYHFRTSQIDPELYLSTFIYPVWVFQQRNLYGIG
jgi:hypothetical protein